MFHGIKYLIVSLVFSHLGFWSGNLFLIAPFPDLCLLVPFQGRFSMQIRGCLEERRPVLTNGMIDACIACQSTARRPEN